MTQNKLSPHDRLTRAMMTNPKVSREFFEKNLPSYLKDKVDFASIHFQNTSFVDDKLRMSILLYSVKIQNEDSYFYLLVEHQSTPDKLMPFRLGGE